MILCTRRECVAHLMLTLSKDKDSPWVFDPQPQGSEEEQGEWSLHAVELAELEGGDTKLPTALPVEVVTLHFLWLCSFFRHHKSKTTNAIQGLWQTKPTPMENSTHHMQSSSTDATKATHIQLRCHLLPHMPCALCLVSCALCPPPPPDALRHMRMPFSICSMPTALYPTLHAPCRGETCATKWMARWMWERGLKRGERGMPLRLTPPGISGLS